MPYGKLITRFTTGGHDIFITCPAKSMHLEPYGLSVHAFCGTGDENMIPTCRSAGNYYIKQISLNFASKGIWPYFYLPSIFKGLDFFAQFDSYYDEYFFLNRYFRQIFPKLSKCFIRHRIWLHIFDFSD